MFNKIKYNSYKKKQLTINQKFNTKLISMLLKENPELSFGRKNYLEKEIAICKNICLVKTFRQYKKLNGKFINIILFEKKLNNITLKSEIYY
tara:strand:- start:165 stop:440 length:276 start_codon:yes stop_codon:yes gene_type:complete